MRDAKAKSDFVRRQLGHPGAHLPPRAHSRERDIPQAQLDREGWAYSGKADIEFQLELAFQQPDSRRLLGERAFMVSCLFKSLSFGARASRYSGTLFISPSCYLLRHTVRNGLRRLRDWRIREVRSNEISYQRAHFLSPSSPPWAHLLQPLPEHLGHVWASPLLRTRTC